MKQNCLLVSTPIPFTGVLNRVISYKTLFLIVILITVCCATSPQARADTVVISVSATITNTSFSFGGSNAVTVGSGATGIFSGLTAGSTGTMTDLNGTPVGIPLVPSTFLTFSGNPNLRLDLTLLANGIYTPANCGTLPATVGQTCTPSGPGSPSPLNFVNLPNSQSTLSFNLAGNVVDLQTNVSTPFTALFTTQFNVPYQTILGQAGPTGSISSIFSATITTTPPTNPVPEPATMLLQDSAE